MSPLDDVTALIARRSDVVWDRCLWVAMIVICIRGPSVQERRRSKETRGGRRCSDENGKVHTPGFKYSLPTHPLLVPF